MSTIGIVGLGLLGHAIASRLIKAGHTVIGFDVLPDRVSALAAMGGTPASSAAALAQPAEAGCTLLPSLPTAEAAILRAGGILAGARKAGLDLSLALDVLNASAAASSMLKVRGPMIVRGEFPAQMKLDLFMKDIHLMQEAATAVGAPLPFTDLAERLYAAAQAQGHGGEDLAVVVTALDSASGPWPPR